jgi:hypothetical protein
MILSPGGSSMSRSHPAAVIEVNIAAPLTASMIKNG